MSGSAECARLLLNSFGANDAKQQELLKSVWMGKKTPLHLAAMMNYPAVVEELMRKGHLETRDLTGSTPLLWAAYAGSVDVIPVLHK